jgi:hypothetical protein
MLEMHTPETTQEVIEVAVTNVVTSLGDHIEMARPFPMSWFMSNGPA